MRVRATGTSRWRVVALPLLALLALAVAADSRVPSAGGAPAPIGFAGEERAEPEDTGEDASWPEVERLISEQKLAAAAERLATLRQAARAAGDEESWTRALVREVQLRIALHGPTAAVRLLREQPWPASPRHRLTLELFYGEALLTYLRIYSWEIGQRERLESGGEPALESWTREQIVAQADAAFRRAWQQRQEWGGEAVGALGEFVEANNYPQRIRGTLRDAVTYLWVELLADSSLWRPEEENRLYRLDLDALLAGGEGPIGEEGLLAAEIHPLLRLGALLDDLESWHRRAGRTEAAFEARLERLRRLHAVFTRGDDRQRIQADLERRLAELGSRHPWWSVGQALLAQLVQDGEGPDRLQRARRIALEGARAHPDSVGGRRCASIVASIEAPEFTLAAMISDGPGRRSILVHHRNVERLVFRAYRVDLGEFVERAQDYQLLPGHREAAALVEGRAPDREWTVELPPTPDYELHRTFVVPPVEATGLYVVAASVSPDFAEEGNQVSAIKLVLSDLVLLTRDGSSAGDVTVRSGASGKAVAGATVSLYRYDFKRGHRRVEARITGADGTVRFPVRSPDSAGYFLIVEKDGDLAVQPHFYGRDAPGAPDEKRASLVYTDRSVYRPGQEILWKVVAYRGVREAGRFEILPEMPLTVELLDANWELVESAEVVTNAFGSASGSFRALPGRLLGEWRIRAASEEEVLYHLDGEAALRVEEYKRPTFEVEIAEPEAPLRLNRPATLAGSVRYYFGLPVTGGEVAWRVTREPVYPFWQWWDRGSAGAATIVATGAATLDDAGGFRVAFTPEADERDAGAPGLSYRYRLSAEVTDEGGETRSATRVFRLGFVAVEARIDLERGFFAAGEPLELSVQRTDLDGAPRAGSGEWRLVALEQPPAARLPAEEPMDAADGPEGRYRTPGDLERPRWDTDYSEQRVLRRWPDGRRIASGRAAHGEDGSARVTVDALPAGAYRLRYETTDDFGAVFETSAELVVAAPADTPLALPAVLLPERTSVPVGGTLRLLVLSALSDQELELEIYTRGRRPERRILRSGRSPQVVEIPVEERHRGGLAFSLSALRDHQLIRLAASVFVPWDDRELRIGFETFRDRLRPGSRESWRITLHGADGAAPEAGAAELLAYMYDRSLDLFAAHHPPRPLALYPVTHPTDWLRSSLGAEGEIWRRSKDFAPPPDGHRLRGDRLRFLDGYGIGGPGGRGVRRMMLADAVPAAAAAMEMQEEKVLVVTSDRLLAGMGGDPIEPPSPPAAEAAVGPAVELRSDFSETAFWRPHLVADEEGAVSFEFTVPDSVTEWSFWVHALTRDLKAGSAERRVRTVKELMVRPYLPRFLREGDRAEIRVQVNNASGRDLEGTVDLEIFDPATGESLLADFGLTPERASGRPFATASGGAASLRFAVQAPRRVGEAAFRLVARAGDTSDGELRPLPVLPGRLHLARSRFAVLRGADRRELRFDPGAAGDDPTRVDEQLVVTLDAQLFYSVLHALPYLVEYPYECTEQLLNRYLSTGILSGLYDRYPAVARMAETFSTRATRLEAFDAPDPNRSMALEETPWLVAAAGGGEDAEGLVNVLDRRIAAATRAAALARLLESQTSLGGFPWWPGGPPSPYMTLYILYGFAKGLEFGVEAPGDAVEKAWGYLHGHYLDELVRRMVEDDCCWESVTFLNYVLSSYGEEASAGGAFTAEERERMLEFSFRHWRRHSPLLKAALALTLERAGRRQDALLVFDSIMDSARSTPDEGTFWAPEERSWLWYNDTVEGHSLALRALTELAPDDARRHGLVQWLLLNKHLNHWKSTRATAEAIYALVHYLEAEGALAAREEVEVAIGPRRESFVYEPERYSGRDTRLVIAGEELEPEAMSTVVVAKETPGFLFASATWHFSTDRLPEEAEGDFLAVTRRYYRRLESGGEWVLRPLEEGERVAPGDQVEVHLSLRARHAAEYVHLRDPRAAGLEPESVASRHRWDLGIVWYEEVRDSGTNFFFEWLPAGEYTFKYRLRANLAGRFRVGPATLQSMYAPEFTAYSAGATLEIASE